MLGSLWRATLQYFYLFALLISAQAMIAGSQYFVTFDGHFIQFAGNCTYLLARDFLRDEFAVLVKYNRDEKTPHHQIIVLIGKKPIIVDLFKDVSKYVP